MKNLVERTINKYLPSLKIKESKLKLKNLPVFYLGLYDFAELDVYERPFLLIKVKTKNLGPKDFKKHSKKLKELIAFPQIWYLKELHPHKLRRMIENEMNFIVEDKQVHLPSVNISIKAETERVKENKILSGLSENILIREILKKDLTGKSKVEIAELFKTSKMTVGRAIEPLLANELCEENKVGVAKLIQFKPREVLWTFLKKNIESPVKKVIFLSNHLKGLPVSGISALSNKSLLAEDQISTFAIEQKEFNKKYKNLKLVLEEYAVARIELWDRPITFKEDGCINVIDLYLVLKETSDERVQIELEKILKSENLELGKI